MKNFIIILASILLLSACEKQEPTPDGPTDIRIVNITDSDFVNVFVDIGDGEDEGEHNYGNIASSDSTEYFRFEIAYPDALITLTIEGVEYSTPVPDHTFAVPLQRGKFTYEVWVSNPANKVLDIKVVADAPLDDM